MARKREGGRSRPAVRPDESDRRQVTPPPPSPRHHYGSLAVRSLARSFAVKLKLRQKCGALPQSWLCSAAAKDYGGGGRLRSVANHDEARRRGRRCLSAHLKQPRQPSSHLPPPPQPKHPYSLRLLTRERKNERARERRIIVGPVSDDVEMRPKRRRRRAMIDSLFR